MDNRSSRRVIALYNHPWTIRLFYIIGDYIAIVLAGLLSLWIRNKIMAPSVFRINAYYLFFWIPLVYFFFLLYEGLYKDRLLSYQRIRRIFYACIGSTVFVILLMFVAHVSGSVSRLFVLIFPIISFLFLSLERYITSQILFKLHFLQVPLLIVGAGKTADAVIRQLQKDPSLGYTVVGFLEDHEPQTKFAQIYPVLGGFNDMADVVAKTRVPAILIAAPGLPQEKLSNLIYEAQSLVKEVSVVPNLIGVPMSNLTVQPFFDERLMVLSIHNNLKKKSNQIIKRIFDLVLTITGGVIISPILLCIALWVHFDSPGPVLFKHKRIGKNGKEFYCLKFRSMCMNSQEVLDHLLKTDPKARAEWDKDFKLKNDPRITKSGAFLRKTSLDELPQLWNVIKGEMSLVGPRPIVEKEIPRYGKYFKEYTSVLPGITGIWQTSGRSDIDYPERVQMDSWYVHNWSVWIDLLLLWRTIGVVFKGEGAY